MPKLTETNIKNFWSKVDRGPDCWLWKASCDKKTGYGQFIVRRRGKSYRLAPHRVAHCLVNLQSSVTEDIKLCVLHTCDTPSCCNPSHLWEGTHKENMEDMARKGRARRYGKLKPGRDFSDAVSLMLEGRTAYSVGKELGFPPTTLKRALKRHKLGVYKDKGKTL